MAEQEAWGNVKPRDTELKLDVCGSEHCPGDWAKALDLTVQGRGLGGTDGGASGKGKLSWGSAARKMETPRDYRCCWEKRAVLGTGAGTWAEFCTKTWTGDWQSVGRGQLVFMQERPEQRRMFPFSAGNPKFWRIILCQWCRTSPFCTHPWNR